ncbi:MAG TPA: acyl-CoA dehydrogenase [Alphaproteobacteria bacterium]|nr:acyl-CoA dehydrogenase [Alphaproteobacteria bacterium]
MSESRTLLTESANRLFADLAADPKPEFAKAWAQVSENGFPSLLVPESEGGFGGDWLDAAAVLRLSGFHALALPVAESILANRLLSEAGLTVPDELALLASRATGRLVDGRFTGTAQVAWGRHAASIVVVVDGMLMHLETAKALLKQGASPADEPRDALTFENAPFESAPSDADPFALGAFARTAAIAGALDGALERSIAYANERVQFGKPIGKFQAVQQSLAVFAEEAAAVNCAAQAAARALDHGDAAFEIAAAKLRADRAAQTGAALAHQVHGAIGFTQEYGLHRWTRRLLAWACEYGAEAHWAQTLGAAVAQIGAERLWEEITRRADR